MKDIFEKEKKEMIEEIIEMEKYIYTDMLRNLDIVDYYDLLHRYDEIFLSYKLIKMTNKEVFYDRNSS